MYDVSIKIPFRPQECAKEHVNKRRKKWRNILFSDESRFSVNSDNRRIFIWGECDTRNNLAFEEGRVRYGDGGVMVYAGNSSDGHIELYIIRNGVVTC